MWSWGLIQIFSKWFFLVRQVCSTEEMFGVFGSWIWRWRNADSYGAMEHIWGGVNGGRWIWEFCFSHRHTGHHMSYTHKGEVDMCKSEKLSSCGAASHSSDKMGSNSERVGMMAPNGWMRGSGARIGVRLIGSRRTFSLPLKIQHATSGMKR